MAGRSGFAVTITAVDNASASIDAINKRIEGMRKYYQTRIAAMTAPFQRLQRSLGEFAKLTGLSRIGAVSAQVVVRLAGAMKNFASAAISAAANVARVVPALAAVTAAGGVAGIVRLVKGWGEFAQKLGFIAARAGLTVEKLNALENGAELAGVASGAATQGIIALRDGLVRTTTTGDPELIRWLNTLGVASKDANGKLRSVESVLPEVADRIAKISDPSKQAAVATGIFGSSAEELLPWLRQGAAGIARYTQEAAKLNPITKRDTEAGNALTQAFARVRLAAEGLQTAIASRLAPVLTPMLNQFADWVAANRDIVGAKVEEAILRISDAIKNANWSKFLDDVKKTADGLLTIVDAIAAVIRKVNEIRDFNGRWEKSAGNWIQKKTQETQEFSRRNLGGLSDKIERYLENMFGFDGRNPIAFRRPQPFASPFQLASLSNSYSPRGSFSSPSATPSPEVDAAIRAAAVKFNIPPEILAALFASESGFNPQAYNASGGGHGARGLGQLRDSSGTALPPDQRFDPRANAEESARLLRRLYERYGNWRDAIAHYKGGGSPKPGDYRHADEVVTRAPGYQPRYGTGAAPAIVGEAPPVSPTSAPAGKAELIVHIQGHTQGVRTQLISSGTLWKHKPRVYTAMPGATFA